MLTFAPKGFMKYDEFQVWYHVYSAAIQGSASSTIGYEEVIINAKRIANEALNLYQTVDKPDLTEVKNSATELTSAAQAALQSLIKNDIKKHK